MYRETKFFDTKSVILGFFKEKSRTSMTLPELNDLLKAIRAELFEQHVLCDYQTRFEIDLESFKRIAKYYNMMFYFDEKTEEVSLLSGVFIESLDNQCEIDDTIRNIIKSYKAESETEEA